MSSPDLEKIDVVGIRFEEQALVIQYQLPTDVRRSMVVSSQLMLDRGHPDYGDDYENLLHKARKVLVNALDDFDQSEPWEPPEEDDDQDRGMGE
jgi:hypothetical protein